MSLYSHLSEIHVKVGDVVQKGAIIAKTGSTGLAFAFYPLVKWCRENEGFSWPWPHVQSEKKRIKELRREQESQEKAEQDSDKK